MLIQTGKGLTKKKPHTNPKTVAISILQILRIQDALILQTQHLLAVALFD